MISMLNHNKAITAVVCILLAFLLLFAGAQLNKMLNEPETNMGLIMTEKDRSIRNPNPNYLEDGEREVFSFFMILSPEVKRCNVFHWKHIILLFCRLFVDYHYIDYGNWNVFLQKKRIEIDKEILWSFGC